MHTGDPLPSGRQNSTWSLWPRCPSLLRGWAGRQLWPEPRREGWGITGLGVGGGACGPALGSPGGPAWSPGSPVPGRWGNGCAQRMSPAPAAVLRCTPTASASVASSRASGTARGLAKGKPASEELQAQSAPTPDTLEPAWAGPLGGGAGPRPEGGRRLCGEERGIWVGRTDPPFQLPRALTYPGLSIRICEMDLLTAPALSLQSLVPGVRVGVGAWGS